MISNNFAQIGNEHPFSPILKLQYLIIKFYSRIINDSVIPGRFSQKFFPRKTQNYNLNSHFYGTQQ